MDIFQKGDYKPIPYFFKTKGILALEELTKFQNEFQSYDTDTTINEIRDSIILYTNYWSTISEIYQLTYLLIAY